MQREGIGLSFETGSEKGRSVPGGREIMGDVRINSRTVVTSKAGGVSLASGDVCKLPEGGGPVPFVNVAFSADAANGARSVRAHGVPLVLARSSFAHSTGDEAGEDGGVISGTTGGPAMFSNYSFDVRVEGQPVPRAFDPMIHNLDGNGLPNAASPAELQAAATPGDKEILCAVVCFCHWRGGKTACVRNVLATPIYRGGIRCWDPRPAPPGYPAVYVEVPYWMDRPPRPVMTNFPSATRKDAAGNPLPLPWGDRPSLGGTRRPDIVVVKDPTRPPTHANIKDVYEVKFPPDDWGPGQKKAYGRIAGKDPILLDPKECGCKRDQRPRVVPVPVRSPVKVPKPQAQPIPVPPPVPYPQPGIPSEPNVPYPMELPSAEPIVLGIFVILLGILSAWGRQPRPAPEPGPFRIPQSAGVPMGPGGEPQET